MFLKRPPQDHLQKLITRELGMLPTLFPEPVNRVSDTGPRSRGCGCRESHWRGREGSEKLVVDILLTITLGTHSKVKIAWSAGQLRKRLAFCPFQCHNLNLCPLFDSSHLSLCVDYLKILNYLILKVKFQLIVG